MAKRPVVITLRNATIQRDSRKILINLNLCIHKGEFVYLVGRVGSGKSTLIKTLNAELPLQEGEGRVTDFDLRTIQHKQIPYLRRRMGVVFQDFQLLTDRSVHDNLEFVLRATDWNSATDINQRIREVLQKVGLNDKEFKMPHELSGGEQQRVVIARALLNLPDIILADEPTGNLDPATSEQIMRILTGFTTNGESVLMATHNYELIKKFPARILQIRGNSVTETGLQGLQASKNTNYFF